MGFRAKQTQDKESGKSQGPKTLAGLGGAGWMIDYCKREGKFK